MRKYLLILALCAVAISVRCYCNTRTKFNITYYGEDEDDHSEEVTIDDLQIQTNRTKYKIAGGNLGHLCADFVKRLNEESEDIVIDDFGLTRLGKGAFGDRFDKLTTLEITNNYIPEIPDGVFTMKNLLVLRLTNNGIVTIGDDAFMSLTKLEELNLSYNKIYTLVPEWFRQIPVNQVFFHYNHIEEIDDEDFQMFTAAKSCDADVCTSIWLDNNRITTIGRNSFKGVKGLNAVNFDHNYLDKLPTLYDTVINRLSLEYNDIAEVTQVELDAYGGSINETYLFGNMLTLRSIENIERYNREHEGKMYIEESNPNN